MSYGDDDAMTVTPKECRKAFRMQRRVAILGSTYPEAERILWEVFPDLPVLLTSMQSRLRKLAQRAWRAGRRKR
jgi:hypothetical protein